LNTGDEFEELGGSFNRMADQLGKQFDLQVTMSALGQKLQGVSGLEPTIELIFSAVKKVVDCNWLMVTYNMVEGRDPRSFIYISDSSNHKQHRQLETESSQNLPNRVMIAEGAELIERYENFRSELQAGKKYYVVPGMRDGEAIAVLIIGAEKVNDIPDSINLFFNQIGVMLASSLSNVFLNDRLYYQAHHDHLTGLPNRLYLKNTVDEAMQKLDGGSLVVSIFDIDRFKLINDTQGHAAGDELLIQVSDRLRRVLDPSATASRFAGDEFIILTKHEAGEIDDWELIDKVVEPVKRVFSEPFQIGNSKMTVEASLGLAKYPADGDNFITLLRNADAAMYQAKDLNPGGYCFYSEELQEKLSERIGIEIALTTALANGEMEMYYQPIVDLKTRRVTGAEALIRWNRPGHGMVMPDKFIGIAEETGSIIGIGSWVMLESCRAFKQMLELGEGLDTIAVNVSAQQLSQPDFIEVLKNSLELSGMPARYLEIEITESCLLENVEETIIKLQEIRELGVRVAVDDFGTGYSSLQYLKRLPIDKLKIDQMFVSGLPNDENDVAIIRTLVSLSEELKLAVLAEGCETQAQAQFLQSESISAVQGWLFCQALPQSEFSKYTKQQNALSREELA
jgi:diguanylate cyclase (GGDEF)-like protein